MKKIFFPLIIFVAGISGNVAAQQPAQPFTLSVNIPQALVHVGSEVSIEIIFTNTSNHEINIGRPPGDADQGELSYTIQVKDTAGKSAPETEYAKRLKTRLRRGSRVTHTINPGQSFTDRVQLNKLYAFTAPGTYTVEVSLPVAEVFAQASGVVRTSPVTITIAP